MHCSHQLTNSNEPAAGGDDFFAKACAVSSLYKAGCDAVLVSTPGGCPYLRGAYGF